MKFHKLVLALGVAALGSLPLAASATITSSTLNLSDCTVSEATAAAASADDCIGRLSATWVRGPMNPNAGDLNSPLTLRQTFRGTALPVLSIVDSDPWSPGAFAHNDWVEAAKYDKGDATAGNLGLIVTGSGAVRQWSVSTPLNGTWIILVKQAREAVLYLFDNLAGATGGDIDLGNFWNQNDYSHVSLFTRNSKPPGGNVPAPGTLALMALGMMTLFARRKVRKPVKH